MAEETLFRNYNRKMECACRIVGKLISMENRIQINERPQLSLRTAVLHKLRRTRNAENIETINTVIEVLHKDEEALDLMKQS